MKFNYGFQEIIRQPAFNGIVHTATFVATLDHTDIKKKKKAKKEATIH